MRFDREPWTCPTCNTTWQHKPNVPRCVGGCDSYLCPDCPQTQKPGGGMCLACVKEEATVPCEDCGGTGVDVGSLHEPEPCTVCQGSGQVSVDPAKAAQVRAA